MLTGVLITPTVMAAMVQTMATEGGRSEISKLMAMPTAAPIKKIGKMTPPLNPDWMLRLRVNILAIAVSNSSPTPI